jgi:hypothetical protein
MFCFLAALRPRLRGVAGLGASGYEVDSSHTVGLLLTIVLRLSSSHTKGRGPGWTWVLAPEDPRSGAGADARRRAIRPRLPSEEERACASAVARAICVGVGGVLIRAPLDARDVPSCCRCHTAVVRRLPRSPVLALVLMEVRLAVFGGVYCSGVPKPPAASPAERPKFKLSSRFFPVGLSTGPSVDGAVISSLPRSLGSD